MNRSQTSWPPPVAVTPPFRDPWPARAVRYRRAHPFCALCGRRDIVFKVGNWSHVFRAPLEVHHRHGRIKPVGTEQDDDLMTLCRPCHRVITREHRRRAKAKRVQMKDGYGNDTVAYSHIISEVTSAARPRYLATLGRRLLWGPSKGSAVTAPRAQRPSD